MSDVRDRGVPWTQLILRYGGLTADLNLVWGLRISVVCAYLVVLLAVGAFADARVLLAVPVPVALLLFLNRRYYAYFGRTRGLWFATRVVLAHFVHHLCNGVSFVVGTALFHLKRRFGVQTTWTLPQAPHAPAFTTPCRRDEAAGA